MTRAARERQADSVGWLLLAGSSAPRTMASSTKLVMATTSMAGQQDLIWRVAVNAQLASRDSADLASPCRLAEVP